MFLHPSQRVTAEELEKRDRKFRSLRDQAHRKERESISIITSNSQNTTMASSNATLNDGSSEVERSEKKASNSGAQGNRMGKLKRFLKRS